MSLKELPLFGAPYVIVVAQTEVAKFLSTFKEYPPAQRAASFSVDQIIESIQKNMPGSD